MRPQNYEVKNQKIKAAFIALKKNDPEKFNKRLNLSWSNWGFGMESLTDSVVRLNKATIQYIELHGNHYGQDLGYKVNETLEVMSAYNMKVAGICGMFSPDHDLSSISGLQRQAALDYLKREIEFAAAVGGHYVLIVPGAVGRPRPYDRDEFERSADTLRSIAHWFTQYHVKGAVEPIRASKVSFIHTIADAQTYIKSVNHPGVAHINADVFHMQTEEKHIGEALLAAGEQLLNLHIADSDRRALGEGSIDLDTIIMALYLLGFNREGRYVTPELLGPPGEPYQSMYVKLDKDRLDQAVQQTVSYFRERESILLEML